MIKKLKIIEKVFTPKIVPEGDGARVMRVIGTKDLPRLDPFLMLDYFFVKLPAGFPDHPHRGFETVTYLQQGEIHHEDFKGNKGVLTPGTCQWMTAGKGIVHAEMPGSFEEETIGFQLWINLPKSKKLTDPAYQEISKASIPLYEKDKIKAKVISGEVLGVKGPIYARQPAIFIDFHMDPDSELNYPIPENWNAILFIFQGEAYVGEKELLCREKSTIHLKKDDNTMIHVSTKVGCDFVLIAGQPLGEPVEQYGPFVMTSRAELQKAFEDYQSASNGFEGADTWKSEIRKMSKKKK